MMDREILEKYIDFGKIMSEQRREVEGDGICCISRGKHLVLGMR